MDLTVLFGLCFFVCLFACLLACLLVCLFIVFVHLFHALCFVFVYSQTSLLIC